MTALGARPLETIGSYRLGRKLGEGGMGAVYLAEHTLLGRRAAIKVLHDRYTRRDELVERFFNEARAATAIADPGIVQVFDFGHQDDTIYIVMELLEGEGLDERLRRLGTLSASDVLRLTRQLALTLHAAHQRGVIHRDLKPENIFIVKDAEASSGERTKILDFGIAKLTTGDSLVKTETGLMMGTPHYMSPEQCRGAGAVDHRADIYSLGCVAFRLLTGRTVFEGDGSGELVVAHITQAPQAPSELVSVTPAVDALIARCLAKRPDDRFASMLELAHEVDEAMRGLANGDLGRLTPLPGRSPVAALDLPTAPTRGRGRRYAIAALVLAAAAVAAVGAVLARHGDGPAPIVPSPAPVATTRVAPVELPVAPPALVAPQPPPAAPDVPALPTTAGPKPSVAHTVKPVPPVAKPPPSTAKPLPPADGATPAVDPYADR